MIACGILKAGALLNHLRRSVDAAPQDEIPVGTMPEAAHQECGKDINRIADLAAAASA